MHCVDVSGIYVDVEEAVPDYKSTCNKPESVYLTGRISITSSAQQWSAR